MTFNDKTLLMPQQTRPKQRRNNEANKLAEEDRPAHSWYRFVLSYPPHLVREYLQRFNVHDGQRVLDPFCGTGTTLVECKKLGIPSVGIEANPVAHFASQTKVDWTPDPEQLVNVAKSVADEAVEQLNRDGILDDPVFFNWQPGERASTLQLRALDSEQAKLLLTNSISPLPLHKALVLRECIERYRNESFYNHFRIAFANALTFTISNLQFGPEVGVGTIKEDSPVIAIWLDKVRIIANDLHTLHPLAGVSAVVHYGDARIMRGSFEPNSIDAVITSPPYPNEKDYTRTTRLESVMLGFINNKSELRALKRSLVRSNTRGVYKEDSDDKWVKQYPEIQRLAEEIEARRIALGKTSGFERLYARVTKLYFGGMAQHLAELRPFLRPGAQLAYVVGDQASYLRVMIRTGTLLADIAQSLGYEVMGIDLFRTRLATVTKEHLREEVVVLRWHGN